MKISVLSSHIHYYSNYDAKISVFFRVVVY